MRRYDLCDSEADQLKIRPPDKTVEALEMIYADEAVAWAEEERRVRCRRFAGRKSLAESCARILNGEMKASA